MLERCEWLFVCVRQGRRRLYFNGITFSVWVAEALAYSLLTYYLLQAAWMDSSTSASGQELDYHAFGVVLLFGLVLQSNLRM